MGKNRQKGFSLLEAVAFIVVMGLIATGLLVGMNQALRNSATPAILTKASFLANARMQIILMNRAVNGYASLTDPCPAASICTPLTSYATTNSFSVATSIVGTNPKVITVTVTGAGNATIKTNIYNYAND